MDVSPAVHWRITMQLHQGAQPHISVIAPLWLTASKERPFRHAVDLYATVRHTGLRSGRSRLPLTTMRLLA